MCTGITSCGSPTLVTSATIALKPSLWCFCLCGTSWGAESDEELCYEHVSTSKLRPIPFKRAHILVPFIWAYVEDIWNPSMFFFGPEPITFRRVYGRILLADQWGIEPPPAVCQRCKSAGDGQKTLHPFFCNSF